MIILVKVLIFIYSIFTLINIKGYASNVEKIKSSFSSNQKQNLPLEINADQGIVCEKEKNMCTATGNVLVYYGDYQLKCDLLKAYFRITSNNETELERITAEGHLVLLSSQNLHKAFAQQGIYDLSKEEITLRGNNLKIEIEDLTMTAKDYFLFSRQQNYAVAVGQACAIKDDKLIQADMLKAYFETSDQVHPQNNYQFHRIEALKNVIISTPHEMVQADNGHYFRDEDLAILVGNVKITNKNGQIEGDRAEIEIEKGNTRVFQNPSSQQSENSSKRVRVLILPSSKNNINKKKLK